MTANTDKMG